MSDIRQSLAWGKYLESIGWKIERIAGSQIFIRSIPLTPFSVIKIQRAKNPLDFKKINDLAKKYQALFINIEPDFKDFSETEFLENGFGKSNMLMCHTKTILIDLTQSETKLLGSFSENARRNIKKAHQNHLNIIVKRPGSKEDFELFYKLIINLTKIRGFYIPTYKEMYKKYLAFKNTSAFLLACHQDLPIAVVWLGFFDTTSVYLHTGITVEGYNLAANYLLVWEALRLSKKMGHKTFDFEGVYDKRFPKERVRWKGLSEFKGRFHGKQLEYPPSYIKIYSKVFKFFYFISRVLPK